MGKVEGANVGTTEVFLDGAIVIVKEGVLVDGAALGAAVDGTEVFVTVGSLVGERVGQKEDGSEVGVGLGMVDGNRVGSGDGRLVVGV